MSVCTGCGLGELSEAFAEDYWCRHEGEPEDLDNPYWTTARASMYDRALDLLASAAEGPGPLVDLGGGVGSFARAAAARGWDAYSIDPSAAATSRAAIAVGADRALRAAPEHLRGRCKGVTLWCVVAHVPDPQAVVEEAFSLLRPGGRLLLTTPNFAFQRPYARIRRVLRRPLDFAADDHHRHFTAKSIDLLVAGPGRRQQHVFVGTTEFCAAAPGASRALVPAKRLWNRVAWAIGRRRGRPVLGSELQVLCTRLE